MLSGFEMGVPLTQSAGSKHLRGLELVFFLHDGHHITERPVLVEIEPDDLLPVFVPGLGHHDCTGRCLGLAKRLGQDIEVSSNARSCFDKWLKVEDVPCSKGLMGHLRRILVRMVEGSHPKSLAYVVMRI